MGHSLQGRLHRGLVHFGMVAVTSMCCQASAAEPPALIETEFLFDTAPHPQCHASTIAETSGQLVAAWFGGTHEKHRDVGIWVSRRIDDHWTEPQEVANGIQSADLRHPCWNPVLFQPREGPLMLFYKVGPSPQQWWGMWMHSKDAGASWAPTERLPKGILGPIKNKPIELHNGDLLCGSSTEHDGWQVHLEKATKVGEGKWSKTPPLEDQHQFGAIQPTILRHGGRMLQILCRSRAGSIVQSWSFDGGETWDPLEATMLPNPNAGIDAVTLTDGRHLLVYNHTRNARSPLNVAISDNGIDWDPVLVLEDQPGEYSYPAVIQSADKRVHIAYTWKRLRVKHVVLDPAKIP